MYIIRKILYQSTEYEASLKLRDEIMRAPLGLSIYQDDLSGEYKDILMGAFLGDELVGMGVLVSEGEEDGHIRYMAVKPEHRFAGVGSRILDALEREAKQANLSRIILNARATAIPFYRKNGYVGEGDIFIIDVLQLPHIQMTKNLMD